MAPRIRALAASLLLLCLPGCTAAEVCDLGKGMLIAGSSALAGGLVMAILLELYERWQRWRSRRRVAAAVRRYRVETDEIVARNPHLKEYRAQLEQNLGLASNGGAVLQSRHRRPLPLP